jgi:transposase
MKLYGGIDLHSNNCVINLIDEEGHVILKKRVNNCMDTLLKLFEEYADSTIAGSLNLRIIGIGLLMA